MRRPSGYMTGGGNPCAPMGGKGNGGGGAVEKATKFNGGRNARISAPNPPTGASANIRPVKSPP